jgi:hypothetical protein
MMMWLRVRSTVGLSYWILAVCLILLLLFAAPAMALAPEWKLTVSSNADYFLTGSTEYAGVYKVELENVGNRNTAGEIKIEDVLPPGLTPTGVKFFDTELGSDSGSDLHEALCPSLLECKFPGALELFGIHALKPGAKLVMMIRVEVPEGVEGPLTNVARISGGGPPAIEGSTTNAASPDPPNGILHFDTSIDDFSKANPYTQAGGHPFQYPTEFNFETASAATFTSESGEWYNSLYTVGDPKNIISELPPGLIANPQGVPRCALADYFTGECSRNEDSVGSIVLRIEGNPEGGLVEPIYNLQPGGDYPGQLGATALNLPLIVVTTGVRSASDYGVTATSVAAQVDLPTVYFNLWGVPADPAHDAMRGKGPCLLGRIQFRSAVELEGICENEVIPGREGPAEVPPTPFLTMPTECSGNPLTIRGLYDTWQAPDEYAEAGVQIPPVDGCNNLQFEPSIEARPTTNLADAPSGLEFHLHVPQNEDPEGVSTPALKEAVVKFPAGLALNPASADGLAGCTEAQVGLHSEAPAACPDASKLGTVEVRTPLLLEPLQGAIYLATPHLNPSGSLLAAYLVVEGQGVRIKLPGRIEADSVTGQITSRFPQNPQLPFEDLKLDIFGGARGALRTPTVCGTYLTTSALTPYSAPESGPPSTPQTSFATTTAENGGACPASSDQEPHAPRLRAGTVTPQAGISSPFSLRLVREDGSQEINGVETELPPGLVGRLAGIPYCPEAAIAQTKLREHEGGGSEEQASPSCPVASELGTVEIGAGSGPTPLYVTGHVYLAGPYRGAPVSLAVVTPAVAGPFDLGAVVVRIPLDVNSTTTQITARPESIPTILQGIPLDVRSLTLKMSRPDFTRNPTSCEESAISGKARSIFNVLAPIRARFQVGGCPLLSFKPKLSLRFKGGIKRRGHPAVTAVLKMPAGGTNIAGAQVTLPSTELLDNAHINNPCTRTQFAVGGCPAGSVLGFARAWTPLLGQPLEGPVYLMTGFGHELPDLVADLNGQIHVVLDARVDQFHRGLRTSFESVPDTPVSKFVFALKGGAKGLVQNSVDLCKFPQRATARFTAHNGKTRELDPRLTVSCRSHRKHHQNDRNHRRSAAAGESVSRNGR